MGINRGWILFSASHVCETPLSNIHGEGSLRMMLRAGRKKARGVSHHQDLWKEREMAAVKYLAPKHLFYLGLGVRKNSAPLNKWQMLKCA